jgi:hypothetical protein
MGTPVRILATVAFIFSLTACGGSSSTGSPDAGDAGTCGDLAPCTRTVSSTLQTIYLRDDGTRVTVAGWDGDASFGAQVTALIVPDSSDPTGYKTFPVTVGADSSFTVIDVPPGTYFIQVDIPTSREVVSSNPGGGTSTDLVAVVERMLYQAAGSSPDLSVVASKRPGQLVSLSIDDVPSVQFNLTGLAPVVSGDVIRLGSSDNILNVALTTTSASSFSTPAKAGDTAIASKVDWGRAFPVLPDASQGDSTWLWQRRMQTITDATFQNAQSFAKSTDFTVDPTVGGTLTAALSPAPQTGSLAADIRWSQFAALAPAVHPGATPTSDPFAPPFVAMEAVPQSLTFPDLPLFGPPGRTLFVDFNFDDSQFEFPETFFVEASLTAPAPSSADVNYGALAHAQFFDSVWHRAAQVSYAYDVPLAGNATQSFTISEAGLYREFVPRALLPNPIVPEISPPTAPLINGGDAFAFQTGVGLQPILSWSPPALGTASKYLVTLGPVKSFKTGDVALVTVVLYGDTSLRLPAEILQANTQYYGAITAVRSPDRLNDPILGLGAPSYEANTVFGIFQP